MYELILNLVATLIVTLIGVFGAWLTMKLGKKQELQNIAAATEQVIMAAQITVGELKQTLADNLKATNGKLTKEDAAMLGRKLIELTEQKISSPTAALLEAANVDISALIVGAGEDWIGRIKEALI